MGDGGRGAESFANPGGMSNPADLTVSNRTLLLGSLPLFPALLMACQPEPCSGVTANCQGHLARTCRSLEPHSFPARRGISPPLPRTIGQSVPSSAAAGQG